MTQAITARRDGDIFQARMFWLRAIPLLLPDSPVAGVGFESGPIHRAPCELSAVTREHRLSVPGRIV